MYSKMALKISDVQIRLRLGMMILIISHLRLKILHESLVLI